MSGNTVDDLHAPDPSGPVAVDERGRSAQTFMVEVVAGLAGVERRAVASGQDIYAVTVPLVVEAALRMLTGAGDTVGVASVGARAEEETVVITRMWRGWTRAAQADRYVEHYRFEVVATLRQVPGFRGARLLRRTLGEETEFVSLTFFDDLDAVRGFAGADYETAVVAEDARKVLIRFDERVGHYRTAFEA